MALNQEEINEIGKRFKEHKVTEWTIGDNVGNDLELVEKMSGNWDLQDANGSKISPEDLSIKQESAIRKEFNLKGGGGEDDFDTNPLIPDSGELAKAAKKSGKPSEFDTNPLIPD